MLCFQVGFERLNFRLNAWRHTTQELVMSRVQNSRQRVNLNLSIDVSIRSYAFAYPALLLSWL